MREGWEYKTIKECCTELFAGGDVPKPDVSKNKTQNFTVPIYTNGVENEGLYGYTNNARVYEPAVTISARGTIGATFRRYTPFYPAIRLITAVPNKDLLCIDYLYYALKTLTVGNSGTSIPQLTIPNIKNIVIPVPPLSEQQSIVDYLDSAFAKIYAMKANAEKALNEAKALFQASLKEMLEPKEGWEEKKLKEVGRTQTGTTPSKSVKSFYGGDIPFIRPAELDIDGRGSIEYNSELKLTTEGALKSRTIRANSTLMCCIGSVGKTGYATKDVTCNQQINTITPYEGYNDKFVYYALLAPSFQNEVIKIANSAKATLAIISKGKWEELSIHIPLLSEQHSIVVTLDSLNSKVARLQENFDKISQECDALKQALLREVFEG